MRLFCNIVDTAGTGKRCHRVQPFGKLKLKVAVGLVVMLRIRCPDCLLLVHCRPAVLA